MITEEQLEVWRARYPGVDIAREVRKAVAWAEANPARMKANGARFVVNWLNRCQAPSIQAPSIQAPSTADPWHWAYCPHDPKCGTLRRCSERRREET